MDNKKAFRPLLAGATVAGLVVASLVVGPQLASALSSGSGAAPTSSAATPGGPTVKDLGAAPTPCAYPDAAKSQPLSPTTRKGKLAAGSAAAGELAVTGSAREGTVGPRSPSTRKGKLAAGRRAPAVETPEACETKG